MAEYGLDLTDFGDNWPAFCADLGLEPVGAFSSKLGTRGWQWRNTNGLNVYTQNNPETGEYGPGRDQREDERGFASYMGADGPLREVISFVAAVHRHAIFVKDETPNRRAYI